MDQVTAVPSTDFPRKLTTLLKGAHNRFDALRVLRSWNTSNPGDKHKYPVDQALCVYLENRIRKSEITEAIVRQLAVFGTSKLYTAEVMSVISVVSEMFGVDEAKITSEVWDLSHIKNQYPKTFERVHRSRSQRLAS